MYILKGIHEDRCDDYYSITKYRTIMVISIESKFVVVYFAV